MEDTLRRVREAAELAGYNTQDPAVQVALINAYARGFNEMFAQVAHMFLSELRRWRQGGLR